MRRPHALRGEQRTFDLHEVNVGCLLNARIRHCGGNGFRRFFDLHAASQRFRQKLGGVCNTDREPLLRACRFVRVVAREHGDMRREYALRAARHDKGYAPLDVGRSESEPLPQTSGQRHGRVFAREVVDTAVAFGLAQDRDDRAWIERAFIDELNQPRHVRRPRHWNLVYIDFLDCRHRIGSVHTTSSGDRLQLPWRHMAGQALRDVTAHLVKINR